MKTPKIIKLNSSERQRLLSELENSVLEDNSKKILADTVNFVDNLIEELKTSKVSIHNLKQLLGFKSEALKKVLQTK